MSSYIGYALVRISSEDEQDIFVLQTALFKKDLLLKLRIAETHLITYIREISSLPFALICPEEIFTYDRYLATLPIPFKHKYSYQIARMERLQQHEGVIIRFNFKRDFSIWKTQSLQTSSSFRRLTREQKQTYNRI